MLQELLEWCEAESMLMRLVSAGDPATASSAYGSIPQSRVKRYVGLRNGCNV